MPTIMSSMIHSLALKCTWKALGGNEKSLKGIPDYPDSWSFFCTAKFKPSVFLKGFRILEIHFKILECLLIRIPEMVFKILELISWFFLSWYQESWNGFQESWIPSVKLKVWIWWYRKTFKNLDSLGKP